MKPRARWLARFASWFFNTSPEWVAPDRTEHRSGAPPPRQQPEPRSEDGPAGDTDGADRNRAPRALDE